MMAKEAIASYQRSAKDQFLRLDMAALKTVVEERGEKERSPAEFPNETLMRLGDKNGKVKQKHWEMNAISYIEKLPTETFVSPTNEKTEGDVHKSALKCLVCECPYTDGDFLINLLCNHRFHKDCIDRWLFKTDICRCCSLSIAEVWEDDIDSKSTRGRRVLTHQMIPSQNMDEKTQYNTVGRRELENQNNLDQSDREDALIHPKKSQVAPPLLSDVGRHTGIHIPSPKHQGLEKGVGGPCSHPEKHTSSKLCLNIESRDLVPFGTIYTTIKTSNRNKTSDLVMPISTSATTVVTSNYSAVKTNRNLHRTRFNCELVSSAIQQNGGGYFKKKNSRKRSSMVTDQSD